MAQSSSHTSAESRTSPLHLSDRPVELRFSFEKRQSRLGAAASMVAHLAIALVIVLAIQFAPRPGPYQIIPNSPLDDLVWLAEPGPGGGGGGGGNRTQEPPRQAELPGKEKITVPVETKVVTMPKPETPPPLESLNIPAMSSAAAQQALVGAIDSSVPTAPESLGAGTGGGAGTGRGTGVGPGQGSGLGPGYGGGTGGGAYRPGAGITLPRVLREVKPAYTADAMRAKVQGTVWLECIVLQDGSVGEVKVTRSLDPVFGLDQEAIKAAKNWRFSPGLRMGEPVPVIITIELTFTLR